FRLEPRPWVKKCAITKDPRSKEMKRICLFPGVTAPALLGGAFLAILLATGLISETQAIGSTIETKSEGPSSLMPCEEALVITDQQAEKRGIEGRVILVVGNCDSVDVLSEGDSS